MAERTVRGKAIGALLWLLATIPLASAMPPVEAERGQIVSGQISVHRHPNASGGTFIEAQKDTTMEFAVNAPNPMQVRVIPIFWRNSLREQPRFFPYPLPTLFGPDAVVALGNRFYFTAPASGQIGVVDAASGQIVGSVKLGGYLTDLVADEKRQRLLVADAWNGRIVVIDAKTLKATAETKVPQVWSLALTPDDKLVAVSRSERQLLVLDAETMKPLQKIALPAPPMQISVTMAKVGMASATNPTSVAVGFEPTVFRLSDFAKLPADRIDYGFGPRTTAEFGPRNQVGWKRFAATPQGLQLIVQTEKGDEQRLIPMPEGSKPVALAVSGNRLLVATDKGTLVILDAPSETVTATLQITDRPFDIAVVAGKTYAADPAQNRVLFVDAAKGSVVKVIPVPDEPVALEGYEPRWWTQDDAPQPLLFVACRKAKAIAIVEVASDQILRVVPLPFEPASLRTVIPPDPSWWPLIPAHRIAIELTPRLAVSPTPIVLRDEGRETRGELQGLKFEPIALPVAFQRRNSATVKLPDGTQVSVTADNNHTLRLVAQRDGKTVSERWIDTSVVTDQQGVAPVVDFGALKIADQPWNRGIWMSPDQHLFLVADTDEFWRWNAPVISLNKGLNRIPVTLKRFVQLDALKFEPVPPFDLQIVGEPLVNVPERYRTVFYADEPIRFRLTLQSTTRPPSLSPRPVRLVIRIYNMGEEVWVRTFNGTWGKGQGAGNGLAEWVIEPRLRETGIFRLEARAEMVQKGNGTTDNRTTGQQITGEVRRTLYFLRLPKLERPRLLARKSQLELARSQIARYPNLFARYFAWLKEHLSEPHMLPVSLVRSEFTAALPPEQQKLSQAGGWRRYDFAWRLIALQFAAMMLPEPEKEQLRQQVLQVLKSGKADYYCHFHHHGPFFPGFVAAFLDLVAADIGENAQEVRQLREFLATRLGDMNVFAWTLAAMGDPSSERERMLLWHLMTWTVNAERYFTVHAGKRGGTWWLNQRTACHCPFGAYAFAFFYLRHFYGEDRYHHRTFVRGFLTHARLSRPLNDARGLFGPPGPPGEPQRWLTFALSRHPLTEAIYGWQKLLQRLNGEEPVSRDELAKVLTFPTSAGNNSPVPFVMPIGLALGWYDPDAPQVQLDELPTTLFFDGEGEVVMRSDYSPQATEVFFACGIRDHVYRHQPTNLMVLKAGEPLLGTSSLWGDHGCPSLQISRGNSWGNVVVIEPSDWQTRWKHNLFHPRGEEQAIINRFSDATFRMLVREQRLTGYAPAEGGYGGGLNLHGHTQTFLHREGHIVAFETHPEFDYVAGDATLSWLPEQAKLILRQVVFVKPDLLIVYDRVKLGERAERAFWLAATGLELRTNGNRFVVRSGNAFLNGFVAFPKAPKLVAIDPSQSPKYQPLFDKQALGLKVLEVHPSGWDEGRRTSGEKQGARDRLVEFLVVMRVGLGEVPAMSVTPQVQPASFGVTVQTNGRKVQVIFDRSDICGGTLTIWDGGRGARDGKTNGAKVIRHKLTERVNDTYENWRTDPRYRQWRTENRFDFLAVK
jgi:DNA-binding beta-propeller fold protein YncE